MLWWENNLFNDGELFVRWSRKALRSRKPIELHEFQSLHVLLRDRRNTFPRQQRHLLLWIILRFTVKIFLEWPWPFKFGISSSFKVKTICFWKLLILTTFDLSNHLEHFCSLNDDTGLANIQILKEFIAQLFIRTWLLILQQWRELAKINGNRLKNNSFPSTVGEKEIDKILCTLDSNNRRGTMKKMHFKSTLNEGTSQKKDSNHAYRLKMRVYCTQKKRNKNIDEIRLTVSGENQ